MVLDDYPAVKGSEELPQYGESPPLSSVQEIVRRNPSCIPKEYVKRVEEKAKDVDMSAYSNEIPNLDLGLLADGQEQELKKLDMACKDWGFFRLINHGIAEAVVRAIKDAAAGFFKLPIEEKTKYSVNPDVLQGYGEADTITKKEHRKDWSDALMLSLYPPQFRKLELWPSTPPELKEAIETYSAELRKVAERLICCLSLTMGMDKNALLELHIQMRQSIRINYYPTCSRPDQVLGLSPHSDPTSISIVMEEDDVTGLEIQHDGEWVPVKPIPNSLVVNIGDVIEIYSNGKYKSVEHRVVTSATRPRMSYATFFTPALDVEIEPLEQMMDTLQPDRRYKKVRYGDYLKQALKERRGGKTQIEFVKFDS